MKNKQKISADNGVSVSYKVEGKERIKIPFFSEIMLTLLVIIATVGAVMTFSTVLNFRVMPGVVISFIAIFSIIYTVLYKLIKKRRWIVILGSVALMGVIALLFMRDFAKGVVIIYDELNAIINRFMGWEKVVPTYEWEYEFLSLTNFVTVLLSMVLCSLISYFTVVKQSFIATFLLTFPFFEIGVMFGAVPNYTYFSMMIASWTASLAVSRVSNAKIKTKRTNGKRTKTAVSGTKQTFSGSAVVIAVSTILLFAIISGVLNSLDFTRSKNIDKLGHDTQYAFEDFVDYISGNDRDGSLKDGKLYKVNNRFILDRRYFTMKTNIGKIEAPIQIKGFTATVYKDNEWVQTDNYDKYKDLFKQFEEQDFMMGVNTGELLESAPDYFKMELADITLSDFRRKKDYAYEVYYSSLDKGFKYTNDSYVTPKNSTKYSYSTALSSKNISKLPNSELFKDERYQTLFKKYAEFVKKEYVNSEIPNSVKSLAQSFDTSDKYKLISEIRAYLEDNVKHTMKSGKCPKDMDFVEWVLFKSKKGYSTHYASAAAVLMQAAGYPTRYVEGYFIPTTVFNNSKNVNKHGHKTIDVTDAYAHAWIEIFDESLGWVAVEVTPGFWSGEFKLQLQPTPSQSEGSDPGATDRLDQDGTDKTPIDNIYPDFGSKDDVELNEVEEEVKNKRVPLSMKDALTLLQILMIILLIFVLAAAVVYVIHLVTMRSRKKLFAQGDVNQKLKYAYSYLVKLAAWQKLKIKNTYNHSELAQQIGEKLYYITPEQVNLVFGVMLKNAYAKEPATLDEANEVLNILTTYSSTIYKDLSKFETIIYKYVLNLCA